MEHKRLLLVKEELDILMYLALSFVWEDTSLGSLKSFWNHSFDMHLNYLRLISCVRHSESPEGMQ